MSNKTFTRSYAQRDIKTLFGKAAFRCAECRSLCYVDPTDQDELVVTGEIAHIIASSDNGPRGDPEFPVSERNKYPNLILLCGICHEKIDGQHNTYTIDYLKNRKRAHEEWVSEQLADCVAEIVFSELDVLLSALARQQSGVRSDGFSLITPNEKLEKNTLSGEVQRLIATGLMRQDDVAGLLSDLAKIDDSIPGRVVSRFKSEYTRLRGEGLHGDSLFYGLLEFASLRRPSFREQSLGLIVLTHLFVLCEVFES